MSGRMGWNLALAKATSIVSKTADPDPASGTGWRKARRVRNILNGKSMPIVIDAPSTESRQKSVLHKSRAIGSYISARKDKIRYGIIRGGRFRLSHLEGYSLTNSVEDQIGPDFVGSVAVVLQTLVYVVDVRGGMVTIERLMDEAEASALLQRRIENSIIMRTMEYKQKPYPDIKVVDADFSNLPKYKYRALWYEMLRHGMMLPKHAISLLLLIISLTAYVTLSRIGDMNSMAALTMKEELAAMVASNETAARLANFKPMDAFQQLGAWRGDRMPVYQMQGITQKSFSIGGSVVMEGGSLSGERMIRLRDVAERSGHSLVFNPEGWKVAYGMPALQSVSTAPRVSIENWLADYSQVLSSAGVTLRLKEMQNTLGVIAYEFGAELQEPVSIGYYALQKSLHNVTSQVSSIQENYDNGIPVSSRIEFVLWGTNR